MDALRWVGGCVLAVLAAFCGAACLAAFVLVTHHLACRLQLLSGTAAEEAALLNSANITEAQDAAAAAAAAAPAAVGGRGRGRGKRTAHELQPDAAAAAAAPEATGPLLRGIHFATLEEAGEQVLHAVRPVFVVLYDVDLAWVRMLEVYQALNPSRPLKVRHLALCHLEFPFC